MKGCILRVSNAQNANFHGAILIGADFTNANLDSADLSHSDLRWAIFEGASVAGANFKGAILSKTNIRKIKNLSKEQLVSSFDWENCFRDTIYKCDKSIPLPIDLIGKDLSNLDLQGYDFSGEFLTNTNLSGTLLDGAKFNKSYLKNTCFTNASMHNVELQAAYLSGADFRGVTGLTCSILKKGISWEKSIRDPELQCDGLLPAQVVYNNKPY